MQVSKQFFFIRIDKEAQTKKRSKIGSIDIPEEHKDMVYNLQYGTVVDIGSLAHEKFPEPEIGDILLFNHKVEYKPREPGDKNYSDDHLVATLENGDEIRTVDIAHEVFGVLKANAIIIPFPTKVFCHAKFDTASFHLTESGIYNPRGWDEKVEAMLQSLEDLKKQQDDLIASIKYNRTLDLYLIKGAEQKLIKFFKFLTDEGKRKMENQILHMKRQMDINEPHYRKTEEILRTIDRINIERELISIKIHEEAYMELTVLYINPETSKNWGLDLAAGDKIYANESVLYPFDIEGLNFTLAPVNYVAMAKNQHMKKFYPLHNRVLVTPAPEETRTKAGIIIPDIVSKKPNRGYVSAIGPGTKDEPTSLQVDDEIVFGKYSGSEIEIEEQKYLLMKETDVFGTLKEDIPWMNQKDAVRVGELKDKFNGIIR